MDTTGDTFSLEVQACDASSALVGPIQLIHAISIGQDGTFITEELVLHIPETAASATTPHEQTALIDVEGGLCIKSGAMVENYNGSTFTPAATTTKEPWFIAQGTQ